MAGAVGGCAASESEIGRDAASARAGDGDGYLRMLLGCGREDLRLHFPATLNQRRGLHTRTVPGFGLTAGTGLRFARRVELEQGPETMAAARPAARSQMSKHSSVAGHA